jgi:pimeloyl-ACP methyl ester carboxylesterase
MIFETIGNKENPVVLMLNGSFSTGKGLSGIAERIADSYYVILPTYDGHHENGGIFTTREEQAKKIIDYLAENNINQLALIQGVSMGAEVAFTVFSMLRENNIEVDHCLFDGGPFYHFHWPMRAFMRAKFRRFVHQAQSGTLDEITERFSKNKMVKWMIHGDISPYKWFIEGLADSAPYMSDESVNNESDACYTFDFPDLTEEEQKKTLFIWSTNEPAFSSFKKVKICYGNSRFASPGDLGHCGFMARKPNEYAELIRSFAEGSYDRMDRFINDLS